jgi:hypothetical protein
MLLPQRSNWQEAVHDKFEEFAQGLGRNGEDGETEADPRRTRLRLAAGVSDKGRAPRLSHASIAQFQLRRAAKLRGTLDEKFACSGNVP